LFFLIKNDHQDGSLPFQVQIRYSRLDGSELVRVQTLQQSVTQDKKQAEEEINIKVIENNTIVTTLDSANTAITKVVAQNAVQSAAEYAASGDYGRVLRLLFCVLLFVFSCRLVSGWCCSNV
jgi:hypothetical protein